MTKLMCARLLAALLTASYLALPACGGEYNGFTLRIPNWPSATQGLTLAVFE